jgi:hypothetical protein
MRSVAGNFVTTYDDLDDALERAQVALLTMKINNATVDDVVAHELRVAAVVGSGS